MKSFNSLVRSQPLPRKTFFLRIATALSKMAASLPWISLTLIGSENSKGLSATSFDSRSAARSSDSCILARVLDVSCSTFMNWTWRCQNYPLKLSEAPSALISSRRDLQLRKSCDLNHLDRRSKPFRPVQRSPSDGLIVRADRNTRSRNPI